MSDLKQNNREARALAKSLRRLASAIEKDPLLADRIIGGGASATASRHPEDPPPEAFDLYATYAQGGEELLRSRLAPFSVPQLRRVVQRNDLDSSKLAEKWRTKTRLLNFIADAVGERARIGDVFRRTP